MLRVITGPMFSGKTTTLLRYIECAKIANQRIIVYKPAIDTRSNGIMTHSGITYPEVIEITVETNAPHSKFQAPEWNYDVIAFDEAQFLGRSYLKIIDELANESEVICSLLNQDYMGRPFNIAPSLLAMADDIIIVRGVCQECKSKDAATKTARISSSNDQIEIGGSDKYQALCRRCWNARKIRK